MYCGARILAEGRFGGLSKIPFFAHLGRAFPQPPIPKPKVQRKRKKHAGLRARVFHDKERSIGSSIKMLEKAWAKI